TFAGNTTSWVGADRLARTTVTVGIAICRVSVARFASARLRGTIPEITITTTTMRARITIHQECDWPRSGRWSGLGVFSMPDNVCVLRGSIMKHPPTSYESLGH